MTKDKQAEIALEEGNLEFVDEWLVTVLATWEREGADQ